MRQRTRVVIGALLVGLLAAGPAFPASTVVAAPAPRAAQPFTLTMTEGHLTLRDAEPFALSHPTTITGTVDTGDGGTGAITGGSFSTPTVSITQEITSPVEATVFVDAVFSEVSPAVGSVDADGAVLVQAAVRVDLHISVIGIENDCHSTPVLLDLQSTVPYDPATGLVTLSDPDFTIPPAPIGGSCSELIGTEVNNLLAGGGHALTLTLQGAVELPPPAGCPTTTALAVAPVDGSRLGDEVALTASVAEAADTAGIAECEDTPTHPGGFVEFRDGPRVLGTVAIDGGQAVLTTAALPAGHRNLSARYRGEPPYSASTSETVSYRVAALPAVVADLPEFLTVASGAIPFTVELLNTDLGVDLTGVRLDVSLTRANGTSAFTPALLVVEYHDGTAWQAVTLVTQGTRQLVGAVGQSFSLGLGETREVPLRLTLQPNPSPVLPPGEITVTFELVEVDPETDLPAPVFAPAPGAVSTTVVGATMIGADRLPSALDYQNLLIVGSTVIGGSPAQAAVVRQGYAFTLPGLRLTPNSQIFSGYLEVTVGGRRLPIRRSHNLLGSTPLSEGYFDRLPIVDSLQLSVDAMLPPDFPTGDHEIRVRYSGNPLYLPSMSPAATLTVLPAVAPIYDCQSPRGIFNNRYGIQVQAHADVPSYALPGAELALDRFAVSFVADRGRSGMDLQGVFGTGEIAVGEGRLSGITFGIGPDGEGTAASLTRTGTLMVLPEPDPDQTVTFAGETGSVVVAGEAGEVVPVTLDSISLNFTAFSNQPASAVLCRPVGDPIVLGEVTLIGTALSVAPSEHVRAGDEVELSVQVHPVGRAGNVVFSDGGATIGVVPVAEDGTASTTWTAIEGSRELSARFLGGLAVLSTADAVAVEVGPTHDCAAFVEEGSGAVVRLAYMELLGRCPDPGGFAHWTARLDGGLSAEAFARQIAYATEALGRVVDDAYRTVLHRPAASADRAYWVGRLRGTGRYDQLLADLAASGEFWTAAGSSNAGFVDLVYERVLGRPAGDADRAYWTGRLGAGESSRVLVRTLARLAEPLGVIVDGSYDEILSRAPNAAERAAAVTRLRGDGDRSALYSALIGTAEFRTRAQQFPNPED